MSSVIFSFSCKNKSDEPSNRNEPAIIALNEWPLYVEWSHYYNREDLFKNQSASIVSDAYNNQSNVSMWIQLKNVSGRKLDKCKLIADFKFVFPDKTFNVRREHDISGGFLGHLNQDPIWLEKSSVVDNYYPITFYFDKTQLLEIYALLLLKDCLK